MMSIDAVEKTRPTIKVGPTEYADDPSMNGIGDLNERLRRSGSRHGGAGDERSERHYGDK